ncbi:hypothetical protein [Hydrogenophaga luteola]|uniref:Uncharacterized protein n=1 Tax=Hydrogenophaga luteola TaxID=1591122 RepID=A0ABV7W799_9BURK
MRGSEFEKRVAQRDHLSAVDVLGTFDFSTAVIHLKSLVAADLDRARTALNEFKPEWNDGKPNLMAGQQFAAIAKAQPLVVHEYTHFVDATSTLWGLRHLLIMSKAYSSINRDEGNYYKAREFSDHARNIRLPNYYTVLYKAHEGRPWQSKITIGRTFDARGRISSRPILFSQFRNSDEQLMVRSPVSTVSILEASAMAQEIMSVSRLLQLTDPEYRIVEDREFHHKTMQFLYSKNFTEYSVCVHILANKLGCKDALVAFALCSRLTRVALNIPEVIFDKLAEICPIEEVLNIPIQHEFSKAIRDGLKSRDLGIIYYLLCNALPENVIESERHATTAIAAALNALGTSEDELSVAAQAEADFLLRSLDETDIEHIKILARSGYANFKTIGFQSAELDFRQLNLPPALLGDDTIVNVFAGDKNSLSTFDIEGCFFELDDGMSWVTRFSEACL